MIKSWANSATRQFAETGKSKFPGLDADYAHELLAMLDAAPSLKAISPLKSVGLHPLKGNRKGQWAIAVNGAWGICFRFRDNNAFDVEIVDYH
jgi:proteic killer suppression protein